MSQLSNQTNVNIGADHHASILPNQLRQTASATETITPQIQFQSHRSPVLARHGAVCCSQPLAGEIGLSLLKRGANALEACIGIAAALNLLEPCSTGIGGDCFAIYYDAKTKKVEGLNGSGRCALGLDQRKLTEADKLPDGSALKPLSIHTITVPGAVAGWFDALDKWGSGKFTMAELLQPTITLAREGVPIAPLTAESWKRYETLLMTQNAPSAEHPCVLLPNGEAPKPGQLFYNLDLARTLEELGAIGKRAFYEGRIGEALIKCVQARGSYLTMADLAQHTSTFPTPISVNYKGVDVWEIPPNGQGITALLALNILSALEEQATTAPNDTSSTPSKLQPLASLGHNSGEYLHRLIESLRLAFADTRYYVCDTDHCETPDDAAVRTAQQAKHHQTIQSLLSMDYAHERAKRFNPTETNLNHPYGSPTSSSSTVSFVVVDAEGNACSFINSNYMGFGSAIVVPGCGFTLQNRGANFTLDTPRTASNEADLDVAGLHPNRLVGGKRPYHTIIPGLATKDGELYCPFSVMGGFNQPQGHVQVLLNMIEFQMDPQLAVDSSRFCIESGLAHGEVLIEDGIKEEAIQTLKQKGHLVECVNGYDRMVFGRGQIIRRIPADGAAGQTSSTVASTPISSPQPTGHVLWCGSDGRADGGAIGY